MRRRHFLRLTGLGALGGVALPLLGGCGTGVPAPPPGDPDRPGLPSTPLAAEVATADAVGKPVLVLVVPDDDLKSLHGNYFGTTLHTADAVLLRELATVHVVCATTAEIAEIAPSSEFAQPSPAYLVCRGQSAWTVSSVQCAVPPEPETMFGVPDETGKTGDDLYHEWVAPFRDALIAAIAGDADTVRGRAARARSLLSADDAARVAACLDGNARPDEALLAAAAPVFRADDRFSTRDEDRWTTLLAASARQVLIERRIPGSRWATHSGCGTRIDGVPDNSGIACGMGFVPAAGQRFLWLYADEQG